MPRLLTLSMTILAATGLFALSACDRTEYQKAEHPILEIDQSRISGEATYRERIALPPGAYALVKLNNISRADAPSVTLTEQQIELDGQSVPFQYQLDVASLRLVPSDRYAVRVEIRDSADTLLWTTDQVYPVNPDLQNQTLAPITLKKV